MWVTLGMVSNIYLHKNTNKSIKPVPFSILLKLVTTPTCRKEDEAATIGKPSYANAKVQLAKPPA